MPPNNNNKLNVRIPQATDLELQKPKTLFIGGSRYYKLF